ncbi:DUF6666 family protein [Rubripirellula lacrimiformis]|nr:DUF6666 family protein [Rubripirellula lacrimiformis]
MLIDAFRNANAAIALITLCIIIGDRPTRAENFNAEIESTSDIGVHGYASLPEPSVMAYGDAEHDPCSLNYLPTNHWSEYLTMFSGIDGSKQPQDYGVNANLGVRFAAEWAAPLSTEWGLGYQIGTAFEPSDNAVQVFELLGEDTTRIQNHTTAGVFHRGERLGWGIVHDFLYQDGFDTVTLGQWRARIGYRLTPLTEMGVTGRARSTGDDATFNGSNVRLQTVDQVSAYIRRTFDTGVQGTLWMGIADGHSESNAVVGTKAPFDESMVIGADILCPLNESFAIYGETNLIFPADTGTVDAMLGIQWYPGGNAKRARRQQYSAFLPTASDSTFSVDLIPQN